MADTPMDMDPTKVLKERDDAQASVKKAQDDLFKMVGARDKLLKDHKRMQGELNTAKTRVKQLEKKLKESDAEKRLAERDNLKKQCAAAQSAAEKAKKEASGKDALIDEKKQETQRLQRKVDQLGSTMEAMQVGRDAAVKRESEALTRESTALGKVSGLEEKIKKLQEDLAKSAEEKASAQKEINTLRRAPQPAANP